MQKLEALDLTDSSIGCNGAEALADSITSWGLNSPLKILALTNCKITSGLELLKSLAYCLKHECLELSQNPLARSLKDLPPNTSFPDLRWLYLSQTSLTGEDIQALAAVIKNKGMPSLQDFQFGYDKLNDTKYDSALLNDQLLERLNLADESVETLQALKYILGNSGWDAMIDGGDTDSTSYICDGDIFVKYVESELQRRF